MKRNILWVVALAILALLPTTGQAAVVDTNQACKAATHFLQWHTSRKSISHPQLVAQYDRGGTPAIYVFNIDSLGFIVMCANDCCTPVLGYSLNGPYDEAQLSPSFRAWIVSYADAIPQVAHNADAQSAWSALAAGDRTPYLRKGRKSVEPLLSSRWSQRTGYNNFCPEYDGRHSVTGCVATAMAQILRYHGYPQTGFGKSSYVHEAYGRLTVHHDSAFYDFSHMPDEVSGDSDTADQNAVSLLCYHCGVAVSMTYEYQYHTSGSGAPSSNVPEALAHFGYFGSQYVIKNTMESEAWKARVKADLDRGLPVYYQGYKPDGGHAFVCDGYQEQDDLFHFNWGWGGYQDGFYTLDDMNGFVGNQGAVFGIIPSGLAANRSIYYAAPNGRGDGSSWEQATGHPELALQARSFYKSGQVWLREGTYYGDTTSATAFTIPSGVTLCGGFGGYESNIAHSNINDHPTYLNGQNRRRVARITANASPSILREVILTAGNSSEGSALSIANENGVALHCHMTDNHYAEGPAVSVNSGNLFRCYITDNTASEAINSYGATITSCLIANNDAVGVSTRGGTMSGNTIVSNSGEGLLSSASTKMLYTLLWNNRPYSDSSQLQWSTNTACAIERQAVATILPSGDTSFALLLSSDNESQLDVAPLFVNPTTERGLSSQTSDWHLQPQSPLVDAGPEVRFSGYAAYDLHGNRRVYNSRIDIGCYEYNTVGIVAPNGKAQLRITPTIAHDYILIDSPADTPAYIIDNTGRRLRTLHLRAGQNTLRIGTLPAGGYLLQGTSATGRFIKQ
ncbi:MAG: C10 family peptidase [Bacteroidales bacterium]|nr:C10 family peptidase [Bacteroidales bacterium]